MHDSQKYNPTQRFSNRAKHYSQARPDYPQAALDFVCRHCGLVDGSYVCDIGAGTGISARAFAERGLHVVGVEPNEAMLSEANEHPEHKDNIEYVKATAENTGLAEATYNAVICAQAFHWFDPEKAINEFQRLLKTEGWIVLIWNERDESDPFTKSYGDLLRLLPDTARVEMKRGQAGQPLMDSPRFKNRDKNCFANSQIMDLDKLIGRALSSSYGPVPGSQEEACFVEKLRQLFVAYQQDGLVIMKYECSVYTAQNNET